MAKEAADALAANASEIKIEQQDEAPRETVGLFLRRRKGRA